MSAPFSFGPLRGRGGSPLPSASFRTDSITTSTWKFTCGHIIKQEQGISSSLFGSPSTFFSSIRSFQQKCPPCLEDYEKKQQAETAERDLARFNAELEAARAERDKVEVGKKKEEAEEAVLLGSRARQEEEKKAEEEAVQARAKEKEQEAKSLTLYKSQAAFIAKQIEDAGDDQQTCADFTKILKNCKLLWANKIRKSTLADMDTAFAQNNGRKELQDRLEKAELMVERAEILRDQHAAKGVSQNLGTDCAYDEKRRNLIKQVVSWKAVVTKFKKAMETYDEKIAPHLSLVEEFEKETKAAWEWALKLMKE
jgi:hypothetical protein